MKTKKIFIGVVMMLLVGAGACADDTNSSGTLVTSAYVRDMYNQLISQISSKQDILPMVQRPEETGKYQLVWDSDIGQFIFEEIVDKPVGLQCDAGKYDIGVGQCIAANNGGKDFGYYNFDGSTNKAADYGLTQAGTWGVAFSYGNVSGISSCNNTNGLKMYTVTDQEFQQTATGAYCWCKMTAPMESKWVFLYAISSLSHCKQICPNYCGNNVRLYDAMRTSVFGSVWK